MLFVKNFFQAQEVCVLRWHRHTNRHTHTLTWQLYDQPGPEGRVVEKYWGCFVLNVIMMIKLTE